MPEPSYTRHTVSIAFLLQSPFEARVRYLGLEDRVLGGPPDLHDAARAEGDLVVPPPALPVPPPISTRAVVPTQK
jgi:hypothetical protein